ncbi:branched-chain amino acid ABC transporter, permease protein, partial [[Clostridium] asparagiforme DSM 15981]
MLMKRQPEEKNSQWMNYVVSLALVMAIAAILITIQGSSPAEAFGALIKGAVGSTSAISSSIRWSTPVLIATIAAIVAQKTGITNLGLEGQIYFGAFASAIAGAFLSEPRLIHIPIAILAGGLAGLAYAVLPAFLKAVFQINEMIVTLMLNYAAVLFTEYFTMMLMGLNSDTNPDQIATPEILESARLTQLLPPYQATTGIFIALGIALAVFAFFKFTRRGYEWRMLGRNSRFARYGGVRVVQNMTFAFLLSGFISGVCGAVEIMGP